MLVKFWTHRGRFNSPHRPLKEMEVDIDPKLQVQEVKEVLQQFWNMPASMMVLAFEGQQLRDERKTMEEYNVHEGANIFMYPNVRSS